VPFHCGDLFSAVAALRVVHVAILLTARIASLPFPVLPGIRSRVAMGSALPALLFEFRHVGAATVEG
jgi:hypothetical protein